MANAATPNKQRKLEAARQQEMHQKYWEQSVGVSAYNSNNSNNCQSAVVGYSSTSMMMGPAAGMNFGLQSNMMPTCVGGNDVQQLLEGYSFDFNADNCQIFGEEHDFSSENEEQRRMILDELDRMSGCSTSNSVPKSAHFDSINQPAPQQIATNSVSIIPNLLNEASPQVGQSPHQIPTSIPPKYQDMPALRMQIPSTDLKRDLMIPSSSNNNHHVPSRVQEWVMMQQQQHFMPPQQQQPPPPPQPSNQYYFQSAANQQPMGSVRLPTASTSTSNNSNNGPSLMSNGAMYRNPQPYAPPQSYQQQHPTGLLMPSHNHVMPPMHYNNGPYNANGYPPPPYGGSTYQQQP